MKECKQLKTLAKTSTLERKKQQCLLVSRLTLFQRHNHFNSWKTRKMERKRFRSLMQITCFECTEAQQDQSAAIWRRIRNWFRLTKRQMFPAKFTIILPWAPRRHRNLRSIQAVHALMLRLARLQTWLKMQEKVPKAGLVFQASPLEWASHQIWIEWRDTQMQAQGKAGPSLASHLKGQEIGWDSLLVHREPQTLSSTLKWVALRKETLKQTALLSWGQPRLCWHVTVLSKASRQCASTPWLAIESETYTARLQSRTPRAEPYWKTVAQ